MLCCHEKEKFVMKIRIDPIYYIDYENEVSVVHYYNICPIPLRRPRLSFSFLVHISGSR